MLARPLPSLPVALAILIAAMLPARANDLLGRSPAPGVGAGVRAESYYLYCLSQQAMLRREYAEALRLLEDAARADPNAAILAIELARVYLNLEEPERAIAEAKRAAALDPNAIEPKRLLVETYRQRLLQQGPVTETLFDRAVAAHLDLMAADPSDAEARLGLAKLYMARGMMGRAVEVLRAHMKVEPASVEGAYLLGRALAESGAREEAREVLEEAARNHPQYPDLRRALAEVIEADGDLAGAASILRSLVGSGADRPGYRFALARVLTRMEKHDEAAEVASGLVRALSDAAPGTSEEADLRAAHFVVIDSLAAGGRMSDALEATLRAERQFPGEVRYRLRRVEILLITERDGEAAAILEALSHLSGPSRPDPAAISEVYLRAGARMEQQRGFDRAAALLRKAIEIEPGSHQALNYLGYMLAERGSDLQEALALIQEAVRLDGENGAYLDSLGWAFFRLGRHTEAREHLERAARLIPEEAVVHDHLGDVYWALGMPEDAVKAWREAIRLGVRSADEVRKKIPPASGQDPP